MKYVIVARYGVMSYVGEFLSRSKDYRPGDLLVLKTERGTEIGEFIGLKGEFDPEEQEYMRKKVIGVASADEIARMERIREVTEKEETAFCREKIKEFGLKMRLKHTEHIFGGERIVFYFTAEERVDFRKLVKKLAEKYKTRIEMKQIGARDEALLLVECGMCGRNLCCRSILRDIQPVSMKMAKRQTSTLDPAKVSGRCGRLKCCFRFEHDTYREMSAALPAVGDIVKTRDEEGEVVEVEVLKQRVKIAAGGELHEVDAREIIEVIKR